jgi:hypothetical protein
MQQKRYWLRGLGIGAAVGVVLYILSILAMFLIEGCYRIPSGQIGMCGLFTAWTLALGWIWIVAGLFIGTIIGLCHKYLKVVVPVIILIIAAVAYFFYSTHIRRPVPTYKEGMVQIHNDGSKFMYTNGQWQPY